MFYVYEWFIENTNEIIYVGKGSKKRYLSKQHNKLFKEFVKRFNCKSRIVKKFDKEEDAFMYEYEHIEELKLKNQCVCNILKGGFGGGSSYFSKNERWNEEQRKKYSKNNVMKAENQRERMKTQNPMKNSEIAKLNGEKHKKAIIVDKKEYKGLIDLANEYNVSIQLVRYWLKSGHTNKNETIKYKKTISNQA